MLLVFLKTPAWVGPAFAALVYVVVRYAIPGILRELSGHFESVYAPVLANMATVSEIVAPWLALVVLLVSVLSLIQKAKRKEVWSKNYTMETLRGLDWREFEHLVAEFYRCQGYAVEARGGPQADQGIDLILRKADETILVQCKHWKNYIVGVGPVRELMGVVYSENAQKGILVSGGHFTKAAEEFAERTPIALVNGRALLVMIATTKGERTPPMTKGSPSDPACPKCGGPMVRKVARKGRHAGRSFFSCANYPRCKGIVDSQPFPWF